MSVDQDRALLTALLEAEAMDSLALAAQARGEIGFYLPAEPTRVIPATAASAALAPDDWIFPGPDGLGPAIVRGMPLARIAARMLRSADDAARGRALPGFLWSRERRIAPPSIQHGASIAQAAGAALESARRRGGGVVLVVAGELACATGALEGPLTLARAHGLPLVVVLVGNVPAAKAERVVAGCALAVRDAVAHAAARARGGEGPTVIAVEPRGPGLDRLAATFDRRAVAEARSRVTTDAAAAFELARASGVAHDPSPLDHVTALEGAVRAAQRARLARSRDAGG